MATAEVRKRIWGWYFFDWASQPYATLLITFIFAPYVKELLNDGAAAQATWGFGVGLAGIMIALLGADPWGTGGYLGQSPCVDLGVFGDVLCRRLWPVVGGPK